METQSLSYYYKELSSNRFIVDGKPVEFEELNGNRGVVVFDAATNPKMVESLDKAAALGMGGIRKISEGEYRDIKARLPFNPTQKKSWMDEPLKVANRQGFRPQPPKGSGAQPAKPAEETAKLGEPAVVQGPPDQPDFRNGQLPPPKAPVAPVAAAAEEAPPFRPAAKRIGKPAKPKAPASAV